MFTLIYLNGRFNRPDTLQPFLETNVGKYPLMQIDCVTPYHGTERGMVEELGRSVISPAKATDYISPVEDADVQALPEESDDSNS